MTLKELTDYLINLSNKKDFPLDVFLGWETFIRDVRDNYEKYKKENSPKIDQAFRYDKKYIERAIASISSLLKNPPLAKNLLAEWLLGKLSGNLDREIIAGIMELVIADFLVQQLPKQFTILDVPGPKSTGKKTTDFALKEICPVEIKRISGDLPALRDNAIKANKQHRETRCPNYPKKGLTFVCLSKESIGEVTTINYLNGLTREIALLFKDIEDTAAIFVCIDEFNPNDTSQGVPGVHVGFTIAPFSPARETYEDVVPEELRKILKQPAALDPRILDEEE